MSLFAPLSALLASKAGTAAAAGLAVATATAGVATASAVLAEDTDETIVQQEETGELLTDDTSQGDLTDGEGDLTGGDGDDLTGEGDELTLEGELEEEEGPDEAGLENRSDTANRVQEVVSERDSYESGRDFGQAVSSAARGDGSEEEAPGAHGRARAEESRSKGQPGDEETVSGDATGGDDTSGSDDTSGDEG